MPRQRDYAAEYARRVAKAQAKAQAESKPFSLSQARGHGSKDYEREQQRLYRERKRAKQPPGPSRPIIPPVDPLEYWIRRTTYGIPLDEYRALTLGALEMLGGSASDKAFMVERLKSKYADTQEFLARVHQQGMSYKDAAVGSGGQLHYFSGRLEFLPVEVYWYHGGR